MFEHRQSAPVLYNRYVAGGNALLGLAALMLLIAVALWQVSPWLTVAGFVVVIIGGFVRTLRLLAADSQSPDEFVCRIDHELIECICPDEREGESFQLRLIEIVRLERMPGDGSHGWYVFDVYGRRYWLTSHYGNPADTFAKLIENGNLAVDMIE